MDQIEDARIDKATQSASDFYKQLKLIKDRKAKEQGAPKAEEQESTRSSKQRVPDADLRLVAANRALQQFQPALEVDLSEISYTEEFALAEEK